MAPLPFLTAPAKRERRKLGNSTTGVIEMEVRGGLTVLEASTISDLLSGHRSSFVEGARIADAIAKEEDITLSEAFRVLEDALSNDPDPASEELRGRHQERIQELLRIYTKSGERNMVATVTALIRSRCEGCADWSTDDTRNMPEALFVPIWELAQEEQKAEGVPAQPPTEDDLKKPRAGGRTQTKRTGKASSGS